MDEDNEEKVEAAYEAAKEKAIEKAGAEAEVPAKVEDRPDDIFDGVAREIVSREVAHREGRPEGRSLVLEIPEDGEGGADIISYGRSEMIGKLDRVLDKEKVKHRGIEVDASVTEAAEKMAKLGDMAQRQVSAATKLRKVLAEKMGLPELPGIIEEKLLAFEGSKIIEKGGQESGTSEAEE